jgi:hypothetical protein
MYLTNPMQTVAPMSTLGRWSTIPSTMNIQAVDDWLRVRRELLDMETAFTKLAIKVTEGEESE